MTIIERIREQKQRLDRTEGDAARHATYERAVLRELMERALAEQHSKADLARAMGVSRTRVGHILNNRSKTHDRATV